MHIVDGNDDDVDEKNNVQKNCLHFGASECQSHKCYLTSYAVEGHLSSKLYRMYMYIVRDAIHRGVQMHIAQHICL